MINSCLWLSGLLCKVWRVLFAYRQWSLQVSFSSPMLCSILDKIFVNPTKYVKYKCRLKLVIGYWLTSKPRLLTFFFTPLFFKIRQGNILRCSKIMCPVKTNNILGIMIQIPKCDQIGTESRDYSARGLGVSCVFLPTQRRLAVYIYPSWFYDPLLACTTCS